MSDNVLAPLADTLALGALLNELRSRYGRYELVDHWQQGEFHHDTLLRLPEEATDLPGRFLVVSTNCNGGVKEVLCFAALPERSALWHARCPDNPDFSGELPEVLACAKTLHWFDPCDLLGEDARSELRCEFRQRQRGGGWEPLG